MLKRKRQAEESKQQKTSSNAADQSSTHKNKVQRKEEARDVTRYVNKQRTLVLSSRGVTHRDRHLMADLRDLLPNAKKDVKFDAKDDLSSLNELAEMKNCNNLLFLEARKRKDLYLWVSKVPSGPSAKFLVQNVHTLAEVKMTGNCLKGSRPLLAFDAAFESTPALQVMKELLQQVFGAPKGHPKVKPFIDHQLSFFYADNRIWMRNYQLVYDLVDEGESARAALEAEKGTQAPKPTKKKEKPVLVEIGPRFVLNPIKIFAGSMGGATLWENPHYVSPNTLRSQLAAAKSNKYKERAQQVERTIQHREASRIEENPIDTVFAEQA